MTVAPRAEIDRRFILQGGGLEIEQGRLRDLRARWTSMVDERRILDHNISLVADMVMESFERVRDLEEEMADSDDDE